MYRPRCHLRRRTRELLRRRTRGLLRRRTRGLLRRRTATDPSSQSRATPTAAVSLSRPRPHSPALPISADPRRVLALALSSPQHPCGQAVKRLSQAGEIADHGLTLVLEVIEVLADLLEVGVAAVHDGGRALLRPLLDLLGEAFDLLAGLLDQQLDLVTGVVDLSAGELPVAPGLLAEGGRLSPGGSHDLGRPPLRCRALRL